MNNRLVITLASLMCSGLYAMHDEARTIEELTKNMIFYKRDIKTEYQNLLSAVVVSAHHAQLPRTEGMAGIVSQTLIEYPYEIAIESKTVMAKLNQARVTTLQEFVQQKQNGASYRVAMWKGLQKSLSQQIPEVVYPDSFDEDIQHDGNSDEENQKILKLNTQIPVTPEYIQGNCALFLERAMIVALGGDKK